MGRSLKNFDQYFQKLEHYCQASEIEIQYKEHDNDGSWVPSRRRIILDRDLDESTAVSTLLHELGHTTDDYLKDPKQEKKYDKAYKAFYDSTASEKQKKLVIECEERAWMYGRGIAKKLRIPLGKWFNVEEKQALESYKEDEQNEGAVRG